MRAKRHQAAWWFLLNLKTKSSRVFDRFENFKPKGSMKNGCGQGAFHIPRSWKKSGGRNNRKSLKSPAAEV